MTKTNTADAEAAFATWMRSASEMWQGALTGALTGARTPDNGDALETIKTMQADLLAFVERRVEKDLAVAGRLSRATSPAEIGRIQVDYLQDLVIDYNRQAMTVANASGKAMMASFSRLQTGR